MKTEGKRPRILALDILRGFLLCVILIDHLGLFPSPYELFTGRGVLWASAAEGFFIISGLLVGYVFAPRMIADARAATLKLWRRALVIYVGFVLTTILMVVLGHVIEPPMNGSGLWQGAVWPRLILQTLGLQYTYGWADFLRYYALFMVAAPLVLWLCVRGKAWIVVGASALIWLLRGENIWFAWQLLFMGGIVVGYYLPRMQHALHTLGERRVQAVRRGVYIVAGLTLAASIATERAAVFLTQTYNGFAALPQWLQHVAHSAYDAHLWLAPLIDKDSLAPMRLCVAVIWFSALYLFIRTHEKTVNRLTHGSLRIIGENSLLVYIVQSFVIYITLSVLAPGLSVIAHTLITTLALVLTYLIALFRSVSRRAAAKRKSKQFGSYVVWVVQTYTPFRQPRIALAVLCVALGYIATLYIWRDVPNHEAAAATRPSVVETQRKAIVPVYSLGEVRRDIPYCLGQKLDIYQPRTARYQQSPVVMYIHGGAWQLNDKASEPDQLAMIDGLRDRGFAVVSIDYSKTPEEYYPIAVEESLCAVRFVRAHAKEYGFDTKRIALYGFSAGGYLAAMVGALPDHSVYSGEEYRDESSRVQAVVTLAGLYDFTEALNPNNVTNIARFLQGVDPDSADVMQHFDAGDPPYLLVHGVDDQFVQVKQDDIAEMRMRSEGMSVQRLLVSDAEHGLNAVGPHMDPTREQVAQKIQAFIEAKLTLPAQ